MLALPSITKIKGAVFQNQGHTMKQLYMLFLLLNYVSWTAAQDPALVASIPECAVRITSRTANIKP